MSNGSEGGSREASIHVASSTAGGVGGGRGAALGGEQPLERHRRVGGHLAIRVAREKDHGQLGRGARPREQRGAVLDVEPALRVRQLGERRQRDGEPRRAERPRAEHLIADAGRQLGVHADGGGQRAAGRELAFDGVVDPAAQPVGRVRAGGRADDEELSSREVEAHVRDLGGGDEAHFAERESGRTGRRNLREPHGSTGCQTRNRWADFSANCSTNLPPRNVGLRGAPRRFFGGGRHTRPRGGRPLGPRQRAPPHDAAIRAVLADGAPGLRARAISGPRPPVAARPFLGRRNAIV
jgi:hypothetical protein